MAGRGEGGAIDLAVGLERERVERHESRRHHEGGKLFRNQLAERGDGAAGRSDVGDKTRVAGFVGARDDHGSADGGVRLQDRLDGVGLNAVAAHFDLMIHAAEELERAAGQLPREVAGLVELRAGEGAPRVGEKICGGECGLVQVTAGDAVAADVDLAGLAVADGLPAFIEQMNLRAGDGQADGDRCAGFKPGDGAPDAGLGRAVFVEKLRAGEPAGVARGQFRRTAFPGDDDGLKRIERAAGGEQKRVERGQAERVRDALRGDERGERGGVAFFTRGGKDERAARAERPEKPRDGAVEGERGEEEKTRGRLVVARETGGGGVREVAVGDEHALWPAGGAGGVNDVGEIVRRRLGKFARCACRVFGESRGKRKHMTGGSDGRRTFQIRDHGGRGPAIAQHEAQEVSRVVGIERHVGGSGSEDAEDARDRFHRARGVDRDAALRPDAQGAQPSGQRVALPVQRGVGQSVRTADDGHGVGRLHGALLDQPGHEADRRCCARWRWAFIGHGKPLTDSQPSHFRRLPDMPPESENQSRANSSWKRAGTMEHWIMNFVCVRGGAG